ncbi:MAG: CaiB/BaiF CoA transferase family protein [Acidimicrobiia bacterium]
MPESLDGVRVLSFGAFVAGNTTGLMLAELGCDVLKIEARARPEVLRQPAYAYGRAAAFEPSGVPQTYLYAGLSRSTRSLSLDCYTEEGRELFRRLVAVTDVVVENFGMKVMAKWGCAFDDLRKINPRLVMLSISGYGRTGPRASYLGYGTNIASYVGMKHTWGVNHGTHFDYTASAHAVGSVVAALEQVRRTGEGVYIDVAQVDCAAAVQAPLYLEAMVNGNDPGYTGNEIADSPFAGVFRCAGVDAWLALECEDLDDWRQLCEFLSRPDLIVSTEIDAALQRPQLEAALVEWLANQSKHTAAHLLQKAGLAAGAVAGNEDIYRDPHLRERGFAVEIDQIDVGRYQYAQSAHRMSKTPGHIRRRGPRLGEHTDEVLRTWLDLADDEIDSYEAAGAIFRAPTS